jgi:hypothetical protein
MKYIQAVLSRVLQIFLSLSYELLKTHSKLNMTLEKVVYSKRKAVHMLYNRVYRKLVAYRKNKQKPFCLQSHCESHFRLLFLYATNFLYTLLYIEITNESEVHNKTVKGMAFGNGCYLIGNQSVNHNIWSAF